ncbi:anaerobic sulfatase maturase [Lachnoclostridium sp. Marseille-P6806]|uniref:anaerobic sulfatase maturase n=1 Tax=Lachnoclostridium sp. Marseille-P6806 TaxID=2364793 RepID=UPI001030685B|nr:anaerobic sulfatase maturase [Lachnoclostridium sp. Marseille-P6806]
MPAISVLIKPVSGACNLHCDYCFYCDEMNKRQQGSYGRMTKETLRNVIKRTLMRAEGTYSLAFQGGEPTLSGLDFFRSAVEYVGKYNRNHAEIHLALQTNGYAVDEEWCRFFAEHHFLLGVSVDGLPEIHNKYRHAGDGGDTYRHAVRAARHMEEAGVDYNILTVVHRETAEHIREIYEAYRANGWHYQQYISCLDPLNEERGRREYSLLPDQYGRFLIELFELWYGDFLKQQEPYIRQFDNYIMLLLGRMPEACEQRGSCGIQYVVEADGSVYPCDFYALDEYRLGNFNEDFLPAIGARREEIGFLRRSSVLPQECLGCRWRHLCRCGCYRNRTEGPGGAAGPNYFCKGYQMFFEACGERLYHAAETVRERLRLRG